MIRSKIVSTLLLSTVCSWAYSPGKPGVCANAADLNNLLPGEWCEVPSSNLAAYAPNPLPAGSWNGFKAVMESWNGGAYDTKRERLIIWGGGHHDYSGNEIYAFDLNTLVWERLNNPSVPDDCEDQNNKDQCGLPQCGGTWDPTGGSNGKGTCVGGTFNGGYYFSDGNPRSRHTYGYLVYVPAPVDRFCSLGGNGLFPGGQSNTSTTACFNFDSKQWEKKANVGISGSAIGAISGVDADTGLVWLHTAGGGRLGSWNPVADVWTPHVTYNGWFDYYRTGAAGQGKLLAVGNGSVLQWDLASPGNRAVTLVTTNGSPIVNAANPGFVYVGGGRFAGWAGGSAIYYLNPGTGAWTQAGLAASNVITPSDPAIRGTYGRFQYSPTKNLLMVVNDVSQNVYIYKVGNISPENPVPTRPRRLRVR